MLNIVIPMAGHGSRFSMAGYTDPKPFISVGKVPMVELVIRNLRPSRPHRFIFVCQQAHLDRYNFQRRLQELSPGCEVLGLPDATAGAACTVLAASRFIDSVAPLLIANSDQWVDTDINDFLAIADRVNPDGLLMTMPSSSPKWSYARFDTAGRVCEVVEKQVVSNEATVGIYYFKQGQSFCRFAREMIARDERSQGEFYVAPVYTALYRAGTTHIIASNIGEGMHGLGTPDDLAAFLTSPALTKALACGRGDE